MHPERNLAFIKLRLDVNPLVMAGEMAPAVSMHKSVSCSEVCRGSEEGVEQM